METVFRGKSYCRITILNLCTKPNDPVWWVDLLSPEQFAEGFGSQTPMITGQCYVVRYSPMAPRAISIMKQLMPEQCNLSDATSCKDLHDIMKRDFWVVTPCHSIAKEGRIMEGTRLTIQVLY
jgi:hypothetical protein